MAQPPFPSDLVQAQVRAIRAYDALAQQPPNVATGGLRHELVQALRSLYAHPFWALPGTSATDMVDLRRQARARSWVTAA